MIDRSHWLQYLGILVVASPLMLTLVLGMASLFGWRLPERRTSGLIYTAITTGLAASKSQMSWCTSW